MFSEDRPGPALEVLVLPWLLFKVSIRVPLRVRLEERGSIRVTSTLTLGISTTSTSTANPHLLVTVLWAMNPLLKKEYNVDPDAKALQEGPLHL